MKAGSKYFALYERLTHSGDNETTMSFAEIEAMIGQPLPASSRRLKGWWSNRSAQSIQSRAWMDAGYHTEAIDLENERVTFRKPGLVYNVHRDGDIVLWHADLIKALRYHMGLNQAQFARELGIRQPTVSEWETGAYTPKRSSSKLLTLIAEKADFKYE